MYFIFLPRFECCNYHMMRYTEQNYSFVLPINGIDFVSKQQIKINLERKFRENQFVRLPKSFNPDIKCIRVSTFVMRSEMCNITATYTIEARKREKEKYYHNIAINDF